MCLGTRNGKLSECMPLPYPLVGVDGLLNPVLITFISLINLSTVFIYSSVWEGHHGLSPCLATRGHHPYPGGQPLFGMYAILEFNLRLNRSETVQH